MVLNGKPSNWANVLSGIPQGSILGPVLFIIFVNDLLGVVGNVCKLFADDCKLYKNIKSEADLKELQEDIVCVSGVKSGCWVSISRSVRLYFTETINLIMHIT